MWWWGTVILKEHTDMARRESLCMENLFSEFWNVCDHRGITGGREKDRDIEQRKRERERYKWRGEEGGRKLPLQKKHGQ